MVLTDNLVLAFTQKLSYARLELTRPLALAATSRCQSCWFEPQLVMCVNFSACFSASLTYLVAETECSACSPVSITQATLLGYLRLWFIWSL